MTKKSTTKPKQENGSSGPLKELQELYQFMRLNSLETLELDKKDFHVRLVRQGRPTVPMPVPFPMAAGPAPMGSSPAPAAAAALPANAFVLKSPMMGIFYRAASPSSPPFAKEGDTVKAGDVICLIEAMKVFNDVKAEVGGVISRVFLENGKPVKVGQELFIIERK